MINRELFKSWKSIIVVSMILNVILILIGSIWFDNNYMHFELSALLTLSLLLGPYAIIGFTIVEVVYWILFLGMTNPITIILSGATMIVLGITPWKLWYSIRHEKGFEIPNINSFYSLFKIILIILFMILQTYLFTNQIFDMTINLNFESYYMIFILGLVLLLLGIGIFGRYNIAVYPPKTNFKKIMPIRVYDIFLIISIILSIVTLKNPNALYLLLILITSTIFLFRPFDEDVYKINNTQELTLFYKSFISVFVILIIIPTILIVSLTITGVYEYGITSEFLNYLVILSGFFLAVLIPLVMYMLFLERQVIKPTNQLSTYLSEDISDDNDLENLVNNLNSITVNNEIKSLSEALLNIQREFVDYSNNLLDVTKEKERYETELKLAHEIQYSMVPTDFEEFNKNNDNISLWGFMKAAREVGGDFYDYFKIDEENIGIVIGDVSGKGVSTALIMVKAMTLIRDYTTYYSDLSDALYEVNNELCKDNIEELFIGCWLGKLNTKTGELCYVNAGHKKPLFRQNNGNFEFSTNKPGLLLAGMEDMHYKKYTIHLKPNDALFLYTDGVTDATNSNNGIYGYENLQKILNQNKDEKLSTIIKSIEGDLNKFLNDEELYDDTTMFIVKMD